MNFKEYEDAAAQTAVYPGRGNNITYATLGLAGEAGEVAEKVKKAIRDDEGVLTDERAKQLQKELGDVLWYVAAMCHELGTDMESVARKNIDKLHDRKERGKLQGDGDSR